MKSSSLKKNNLEEKQVYANAKQIDYGIVNAQYTYVFCGRAWGKTDGPVSWRSLDNAMRMPRSLTGFNGKSYESILRNIIPKCIRAWERWGYHEDTHFVIGKKPPKAWNWESPFHAPKSFRNAMQWINGAGMMFFSLDHAFNPGVDLDSVIYDEARYFREDRVDEMNKAVRGNRDKFSHLSCHYSHLYTTDRPKYADERWIYDRAGVNNEKLLSLIRNMYQLVVQLYMQQYHAKTENEYKALELKIKQYEKELNTLRKGATHIIEADTLENIYALGPEPIRAMMATTSKNEFLRGVLNLDKMGSDFLFYCSFNDKKHTYTATNVSHVDSIEINYRDPEKDCRWDSDWQTSLPMYGALDWGKRINCLEVGQPFNDSFRIINSFDVTYPKKLKHLVDDFCDYYRFHTNKKFVLYRDHTAIAESGIDNNTYLREFVDRMKFRGWRVVDMNIGQTPSHQERHRFFDKLYSGERPDLPEILFNADNCENLIISVSGAGTIEKKGLIHKDKTLEENPNADQTKTTHHSEAHDLLLYGHLVKFHNNRSQTFFAATRR